MSAITISTGFHIVIPKQIRESLKLKPGQKLQAIQYENRIEFVPWRPFKATRGLVIGIDTRVARDWDRV